MVLPGEAQQKHVFETTNPNIYLTKNACDHTQSHFRSQKKAHNK